MLPATDLQKVLGARFGIAFDVSRKATMEGPMFAVAPAEVPSTIGFSVEVVIGWRSLEATFRPGPFAGGLLKAMSQAGQQQRSLFKGFANAAMQAGADVTFSVGNSRVDVLSDEWPEHWDSCALSLRKSNVPWGQDPVLDDQFIGEWVCRFVGMTIALLPFDSVEPPLGESEGTPVEVISKRYERSRLNRAACIDIQGCRCVVCSFDFEQTYGAIGSGFIHVHHILPLAALPGSTVIDPARDLVPVCPNCHAMLHSARPPLLPQELRDRMKRGVIRNV